MEEIATETAILERARDDLASAQKSLDTREASLREARRKLSQDSAAQQKRSDELTSLDASVRAALEVVKQRESQFPEEIHRLHSELDSANEQIHLLTSSEEKRTAEHRNLLDASAKQNEALHKENEALNEELRENDNAMHILEEKLRVTSNAAGFGTVTQEAHDKEITELTAATRHPEGYARERTGRDEIEHAAKASRAIVAREMK